MKKKKKTAPELKVPTTTEEIQDSRLRAEALVAERKAKINKGEAKPVRTPSEVRAASLAGQNIVCLGDAIAPAIQIFADMAVRARDFANGVREDIAKLVPIPCEDHPHSTLLVNEDLSIEKSWIYRKFTVVYFGCPDCAIEKHAIEQRAKWIDCGIPHKVLHATFENFDVSGDMEKERALDKFTTQLKRNKGFIIAVGKWGTGKSHLAAALIKAAGGGIFITEHDLIGELRQTYVDNSGQDSLVNKYRTAKVLVLDEVTPDVKGVDIAPLLYRVLGYRHDNDLLTCITSNEEVEVVMSILGPKIRDRIRESYKIANFTWESHRKPL